MRITTEPTTRRVVRLSDDATREIEAERRSAKRNRGKPARDAIAKSVRVAAILPPPVCSTFN